MSSPNVYARLEFSRKINEKTEVNVNSPMLSIGRASSCSLQIPDKFISAKHCILEFNADGKIYLLDSSSNGTFVNEEKVKNQRVEVAFGSRIYLINKPEETEQNLFFTIKMPDLDLDQTVVYSETGTTKNENQTQILPAEEEPDSADSGEPGFKKPRLERVSDLAAKKVACSSPEITKTVADTVPKLCDTGNKAEEKSGKNDLPSSSGKNTMEESLMCSICCEIIHDCVALQPCGHSFCAACYSDWMSRSRHCPECRLKVERITKNHRLNNLIDAYLNDHPNKQRPKEEIEALDARNKITKDMIYPKKKNNAANADDDDDDDSYYSSTDEDETNGVPAVQFQPVFAGLFNQPIFPFRPPPVPLIMQPKCSQCPNYGRMPAMFNINPPRKTPPPYVCPQFQNHILCVCCHTAVPDRRQDRNCTVPIECIICKKPYCNMYFGCGRFGCKGCLNKFKELDFGNDCLGTIINENQFESKILQDYLNTKNLQCSDFLKECVTKLDSGEYACRDKFAHGLTSESVVCFACGLNNFRDLAYEYRKNIAKNDLPDNVISRRDCWYGRNCRTQKNNANHANNLNHICDQTKF